MDGDGWNSSIKWKLIIVDEKDVHGWNSSIFMLVMMLMVVMLININVHDNNTLISFKNLVLKCQKHY
jgi:hypothetical protein